MHSLTMHKDSDRYRETHSLALDFVAIIGDSEAITGSKSFCYLHDLDDKVNRATRWPL